MSVLVAILAAGESRRMGRPKLCLPWEQTTILGHIIQQWREAGAKDFLVVHAPGAETPVTLELDRLGIPPEQRAATLAPKRGMMGSVITAAQRANESSSLTHLVISLGDQPQIRVETLRRVLEACRTARDRIVRAAFQDKPGHPLALPADLLEELGATSSATLSDFVCLHPERILNLTCPDSGLLLDIDTPDDYQAAQALT